MLEVALSTKAAGTLDEALSDVGEHLG